MGTLTRANARVHAHTQLRSLERWCERMIVLSYLLTYSPSSLLAHLLTYVCKRAAAFLQKHEYKCKGAAYSQISGVHARMTNPLM
eukprot:1596143-Pleurochrysis_carterae.AAC.3